MLSVKAPFDAVPCDVDALHGFDSAASVGVGALGGFSVVLADFLEGSAPFGVDGGEFLPYRWGSAPRERIAFGAVVAAAVIAARASRVSCAACTARAARRARFCAPARAAARSGVSPWLSKRSLLVLLPVSLLVSRRRLRSAASARCCWRSSKIAGSSLGLTVAKALLMSRVCIHARRLPPISPKAHL